jgi:hypothetical protein
MDNKILSDFVSEKLVSQEEITVYKDKLPEELLNVWRSLGFGTFMNGYLKIIDPKTYQQILEDSYFMGKVSIPMMVTGFGDIIAWEENKYIGLVKYRKGQFDIISCGFEYFFNYLLDEEFINDFFNIKQYEEALAKYGELKFDECFGYVPLLGLGGYEDVNHLQKVKIKEHIEIITQFMGKME